MKNLADYFTNKPDAVKRSAGHLQPLAEPKSSRTLDQVLADRAAVTQPEAWYCLVIDQLFLDRIIVAFETVGMEAYAPLGKVVKSVRSRGTKRSIQVHVPAFPGYLFIRFSGGVVDWPSVRDTSGVLAFIGNAEREPRRIGPNDIQKIRAREKRGEYNWDWRDPDRPRFSVVKNDRVRMTNGVLAQYTGVVSRTPNSRKVQVVPDLFPDSVVHIDIRDLKIIP